MVGQMPRKLGHEKEGSPMRIEDCTPDRRWDQLEERERSELDYE